VGKKERTKGATFENEVVKSISPFFPDAKRNLDQYQQKDGRDFKGTEPLCIQAKRRKKTQLWEIKMGWIEAREASTINYVYPVVVWRDDQTTPNEDIMCAMKLEHLIEWLCLQEDGLL